MKANMNRAHFLKQLSYGSVLPALGHGMGFAESQGGKVLSDKNLMIIVTNLGFNINTFTPKNDKLESSPLVDRLKDHYNDLTLFKHISQPEIVRGHSSTHTLLTCGLNQKNGPYISLDQFAAEHLQQRTRYKSVNMGGQILSWNKQSRKVPTMMEMGPDKIYQHLFTQSSSEEDILKKIRVHEVNKARFQSHSSSLKNYLTSMEEVEAEIRTELEWLKKPIPKVEIDTNLHTQDAHDRGYMFPIEQQFKLAKLGIEHNRGQVFVVSPPFIDKTGALKLDGSYHTLGHQAYRDKKMYEDMLSLEIHIFDQFSKLLTDLKQSKMLDDTIVLFMGGFCDPGAHSREFIPMILAGGGFKHQGIVGCKDDKERYPAHVYTSILRKMGIDINEFATQKGHVDHLLV